MQCCEENNKTFSAHLVSRPIAGFPGPRENEKEQIGCFALLGNDLRLRLPEDMMHMHTCLFYTLPSPPVFSL